MNNNLLLEQAIRNNPVYFKTNKTILIDEFFQVIRTEINLQNYVNIKIYKPLNYSNTVPFTSHNIKQGKHIYINNSNSISFMIDEDKTEDIDIKHDKLRIALY